MTSVSQIIQNDAALTAQLKAKTDTVTGAASSNLKQSDFLDLLTKQLQFQDPMEPQGNSEFISQMCQFSQLEATNDLNTNMKNSTSENKAESLVGKGVILVNPDDTSKTIQGTVQAARLDGEKSAINVNGTNYSMEYLLYSYDPSLVTTNPATSTNTNTNTNSGSNSGSST